MASLTRRMQRGFKRGLPIGKNLGVTNNKAADLVARLKRESQNVRRGN